MSMVTQVKAAMKIIMEGLSEVILLNALLLSWDGAVE